MPARDSEELFGLQARLRARLMSLQTQLTALGRTEEELGEVAGLMMHAARRQREHVADVGALQAILNRGAELRDQLEEQVGVAFAAADFEEVPEQAGLSAPGSPLERSRLVALDPDSVGPKDVLLFDCAGVRYACFGPFSRSAPTSATQDERVLPRPAAHRACIYRLRGSHYQVLWYDRLRGLIRGFRRTGAFSVETLRHQIPGVAGRFRLMGRWYHLLHDGQ